MTCANVRSALTNTMATKPAGGGGSSKNGVASVSTVSDLTVTQLVLEDPGATRTPQQQQASSLSTMPDLLVPEDPGAAGMPQQQQASTQLGDARGGVASSTARQPVSSRRPFLTFKQAHAVVRAVKLQTHEEWEAWCKSGSRPDDVPPHPNTFYQSEWKGWKDWVGVHRNPGTGQVVATHESMMPFARALAFARSLTLSGQKDWKSWCQSGARPIDIPRHPDRWYQASGWQGWTHWLVPTAFQAVVSVSSHQQPEPHEVDHFLPYVKALDIARSLKLGSEKEWHAWCRGGARPANMPPAPHRAYHKTGWKGYAHWLHGDACNITTFLPFLEAHALATALRLPTKLAWDAWCVTSARPHNLPGQPNDIYRNDGWQSWAHWLGPGITVVPFEEALAVARSLGMGTRKQWRAWCKTNARPANVPSKPEVVYKTCGWRNFAHFLGLPPRPKPRSANYKSKFLPFHEALAFARTLRLHLRLPLVRLQKAVPPLARMCRRR